MQKRIASLFILSFLLFALAICIVPACIQNDSTEYIQVLLIILAVVIDIIAMRYQQKRSANH